MERPRALAKGPDWPAVRTAARQSPRTWGALECLAGRAFMAPPDIIYIHAANFRCSAVSFFRGFFFSGARKRGLCRFASAKWFLEVCRGEKCHGFYDGQKLTYNIRQLG